MLELVSPRKPEFREPVQEDHQRLVPVALPGLDEVHLDAARELNPVAFAVAAICRSCTQELKITYRRSENPGSQQPTRRVQAMEAISIDWLKLFG